VLWLLTKVGAEHRDSPARENQMLRLIVEAISEVVNPKQQNLENFLRIYSREASMTLVTLKLVVVMSAVDRWKSSAPGSRA
jgi:hypothetical protein